MVWIRLCDLGEKHILKKNSPLWLFIYLRSVLCKKREIFIYCIFNDKTLNFVDCFPSVLKCCRSLIVFLVPYAELFVQIISLYRKRQLF